MDMIIKLTLVEASKFSDSDVLLAGMGLGRQIDEVEGSINVEIESQATTEDEYAAELKALFESVDRLPEGQTVLRLAHYDKAKPRDGLVNYMCDTFTSLGEFHGLQLAAIPALKTHFEVVRAGLQDETILRVMGPVDPGPLMDAYRASQVE